MRLDRTEQVWNPVSGSEPTAGRVEAFVGGFMGASYGVRLGGGALVRERFEDGYELAERVTVEPRPTPGRTLCAAVSALAGGRTFA